MAEEAKKADTDTRRMWRYRYYRHVEVPILQGGGVTDTYREVEQLAGVRVRVRVRVRAS